MLLGTTIVPSETMTDRERRTRIGVLIGGHLLVGLIAAPIAVCYPRLQDFFWIAVPYMGFVCSEILLVGMWLGFSAARWWTKFGGLLAGVIWLGVLSVAPLPFRSLATAWQLLVVIGVPLLFVTGSCAICRRRFARFECRGLWKSRPVSEELQFSLKTLIGLTCATAILLGIGRFMQWIDPRIERGIEIVVVISLFALMALLATALLVWSAMGPGRAIVRVPIVIGAMTLLGLLPPYAMGGPTFRYFVWPALMAVVAGCTGGSLLVIRSCGYRLVRLRGIETQADFSTQQCP